MSADEKWNELASLYEIEAAKEKMNPVKNFLAVSHRLGFPVLCALSGESTEIKLRSAAMLLLEAAGIESHKKIPVNYWLDKQSALYRDSLALIANTTVTTNQIKNY